MICDRCGKPKPYYIDFKKFGNDGTKSYVKIVPMCVDCMKELNFPFSQNEVKSDRGKMLSDAFAELERVFEGDESPE